MSGRTMFAYETRKNGPKGPFARACAFIYFSASGAKGGSRRKTMKRIFLGGMSMLVLAFGLVLAGCGNDRSIHGSWSGDEGTLIFHRDGRFEWSFDDFWTQWSDEGTFTARDGRITLVLDGDDEVGTYTISGNTLRLDFDGESMTFHRR